MKVYHASKTKLNGDPLIPRIPQNALCGEDKAIGRICFSSSINGCLSSIDGLEFGDTLYIYTAGITPYFPTVDQVPDAFLFGEIWSLEKVDKYQLFGIVKIMGYVGCEINNQVNNQYSYSLMMEVGSEIFRTS